jgi:hypothetical protein
MTGIAVNIVEKLASSVSSSGLLKVFQKAKRSVAATHGSAVIVHVIRASRNERIATAINR